MNIAGFNVTEHVSTGKKFDIYRAISPSGRGSCILKVVKNVTVPGIKKELLREYAFLKDIRSAYVIRALACFEADGYFGIQMEDIAGQDLHMVLKKRRSRLKRWQA